jgi:hypothetical protein
LARRQATPIYGKSVSPGPSPHTDLLEGFKTLELTSVTAADVEVAVKTLFPQGTEGIDQGEVIRASFLHLKSDFGQ